MQCDAPPIVSHKAAWSFFGYLKCRTVWFFRLYIFYFISFLLGISIIIVFWATVLSVVNVSPPVSHSPSLVFSSLSLTLTMLSLWWILTDFRLHTMQKKFWKYKKKGGARPPRPLPWIRLCYWANISQRICYVLLIVLPVRRCRFLEENESGLRFRRNNIWRFTECTTPL